jgi:hypothetical protein
MNEDRSYNLIRLLGGLLLLILVAWIVASLIGVNRPVEPGIIDSKALFNSDSPLPSEVKQEIDLSLSVMENQNVQYRLFHWIGDLSVWISFLSTALITLFTGSFGLQQPDPNQPRPKKGFYVLGFLAAFASVLTLSGAQCGSYSSQKLTAANEIRDKIIETSAKVREEADPKLQLEYLIPLKSIRQKYQ